LALVPIPAEEETMKSESSKSKSPLTGIFVAIALFVVTVAMHEAARANDLAATSAQGSGGATAPSGTRLRANFLSIPDSIH
jgi:hypothetical protein